MNKLLRSSGLSVLGGVLLGLWVAWPSATASEPIAEVWSQAPRPHVEKPGTSLRAVAHVELDLVELDLSCLQQQEGRGSFEVAASSEENSVGDCQKRCQCEEACEVFTFWTNGRCHLQSKQSTPFRHQEAVWGPARCHEIVEEIPDFPRVQAQADGEVGPKVYVYDLPSRFQNWGKQETRWSADAIFGGPPGLIRGVEIYASGQFYMPLMLHYRLLSSAWRTQDVEEAEVFVIPAYNFRPSKEAPCANSSDLVETLMSLNPRLKDKAWAEAKAPRHLLMDARGHEVCSYMWDQTMPLRLAHRINIELNGMFFDGPEGWTAGKPFVWYQFPYPAMFHGPAAATPARLRPRGLQRYLWSFSGSGRGMEAQYLRTALIQQCNLCNRCSRASKVAEIVGEPTKEEIQDYLRLADKKLQSTFCAEPFGDSITRKSLIDSLVLGCLPVLFAHQELDMFEPFASAEEWAQVVVFIPEAQILGPNGPMSEWGTGTFHVTSRWKALQKLYPQYAGVFKALHPRHSLEERASAIRVLFPNATSVASILGAIPEEEIVRKQQALAKIAHRFVIGLDDSSEDALRILLRRIVSNDALIAKRKGN